MITMPCTPLADVLEVLELMEAADIAMEEEKRAKKQTRVQDNTNTSSPQALKSHQGGSQQPSHKVNGKHAFTGGQSYTSSNYLSSCTSYQPSTKTSTQVSADEGVRSHPWSRPPRKLCMQKPWPSSTGLPHPGLWHSCSSLGILV